MLLLFPVTVFCCCIVLQWGYGLYFFIRIFRVKNFFIPQPGHNAPESAVPVTVLICAKNEAPQLKHNLPAVLAQRYTNTAGKPNYEVVVVDDASTDGTAPVLQALMQQYPHLRVVSVPPDALRDAPGKKFALSRGVQHAAYDHLLLTDADCMPAGTEWLAAMTAPLRQGKEIAAGYGGYERRQGSLLNAVIRWETLHTFLQYSTYAAACLPYMAVGRNLACTKNALLRAMQSPVWRAVPSGDDDLLMRVAADKSNTAVVLAPEAFTISRPQHTWQAWLRQKRRHLSTGKYYRLHIRLLLGIYALSHAGMWLLFFALLFPGHAATALLLMAARCLLYWASWYAAARRLGEQRLLPLFPLFDFGWMIYNFVLSPYIIWKNKNRWT